MLYQYTKRYLKNHFNKPSLQPEWDLNHSNEFISYIQKRYEINHLEKELSEVKKAFKDFFEPVGRIVFRYKEDTGIKFKVFAYNVQPKNSRHLKNIVDIIHQNKKDIKYLEQNGKVNSITISGKIRRYINLEIADTQESIQIKELIKYAIRVALNLSERDIVTQLKKKYIVKIFQVKEKGSTNGRFNGYSVEEIEETYKDIFHKNQTDIEQFLQNITNTTVEKELNFQRITNQHYEANSLKAIHATITKELINFISLEQDYLLGVTGFLMRKHFFEIHKLIAIKLLDSIYQESQKAKNFLLYYDNDSILINNKKYQIPALLREDGQKWNINSLMTICNAWMASVKKKEGYQQQIEKSDELIQTLTQELKDVETNKQITIQDKIEKLQTNKETLLSNIKKLNLNIDSKSLQIDSILSSLVKALISKTKCVS